MRLGIISSNITRQQKISISKFNSFNQTTIKAKELKGGIHEYEIVLKIAGSTYTDTAAMNDCEKLHFPGYDKGNT